MIRRGPLLLLLSLACTAPPVMAPLAQDSPAVVEIPAASATPQVPRAAQGALLLDHPRPTAPSAAPAPSASPSSSVIWLGSGSAAYPVYPAPATSVSAYTGPITTTHATFGALDVPPPTDRAGIRAGAPPATTPPSRYPCPPGATAQMTGSPSSTWSLLCKDSAGRRQGRETTFYKTEFRRYDFYIDDQLRKFVWLLPGHGVCVRWFDEAGSVLDTQVYGDDGNPDPAGICAP